MKTFLMKTRQILLLFLSLFFIAPLVFAASWVFEENHDTAVPGNWDGKHIGTDGWIDIVQDTTIKQEGTASYKVDNNHVCPSGASDAYVHKKFTTTGKHYTVKAYYRFGTYGLSTFSNNDFLVIFAPETTPEPADPDDWSYLVALEMDNTGRIRVNSYNVTSSWSTQTVDLDTWYELQLDLFEDDTNGSFSLKVDGVEWASATGIDTSDVNQVSDNRILAMGYMAALCYNNVDTDMWIDHVRWYRGDTAYSADPDPSPTPTPTPQAGSSSSRSSSSRSSIDVPGCDAGIPEGTPDLFQIDAQAREATVYFVPVKKFADRYFISYGYEPGDMRFGVEFPMNYSSGVVSYTVKALEPGLEYYMRVRAGNECQPGYWGNEIKIKTSSTENSNNFARFYKEYLSRILPLSSLLI